MTASLGVFELMRSSQLLDTSSIRESIREDSRLFADEFRVEENQLVK